MQLIGCCFVIQSPYWSVSGSLHLNVALLAVDFVDVTHDAGNFSALFPFDLKTVCNIKFCFRAIIACENDHLEK